MDDELIYSCFPYYSYASPVSDFTTTTSISPPHHQQQHSHLHHPTSPLPPPPNSSLISSSPNFASFHHDHDQHPILFGSVVEPFFSNDASAGDDVDDDLSSALLRARIAAHPLYSRLLQAYIDCQKVGAPPEIENLLDQIQRDHNSLSKATSAVTVACFDSDPELDEFMESYCVILSQYRSDLAKPFNEATSYLNNMEAQLNSLCKCTSTSGTLVSDEAAGSSEEDASGGESADMMEFLPSSEDQELKDKLLRKYSGYISSLKHEFSKKKKKGKLPKDAKQLLHIWWIDHYKWPYPTEADKIDLAQQTGLDQKQINNWFINQRKRHWKPSENIQFMERDGFCGQFYTND